MDYIIASLAWAVRHSISMGYSDGAYIYTRALVRFVRMM